MYTYICNKFFKQKKNYKLHFNLIYVKTNKQKIDKHLINQYIIYIPANYTMYM